jgi:hypothetical protein
MTFLDQFGNRLRSVPAELSSLQLLSSGSGNIDPELIPKSKLQAPTFNVPIKYYIAETMSIKVLDNKGNRLGISAPTRVVPGDLSSFGFQLPDEVSADKKFTVRLRAIDSFENVVTNIDQRDGTVKLDSTGETELTQTRVSYSQFANGVAELPLQYRDADTIKLIAEADGIQSTSQSLKVSPGSPANYEVLTQERIKAGTPFAAVIRVFDKYNNLITDLPDSFNGVKLSTGGSSRISPYKIDSSLFEAGEANIFLAYPRAGELSVSASPLEKPLENPAVDRFYLNREVDTGNLYLLSSKPVPINNNRPSGNQSGKIQFNLKPADMLTESRTLKFQDWFLKRIEQRQTQFGSLPIVTVNIFPNEAIRTRVSKDQNLITIQLQPEDLSKNSTLREIQKLMQDQKYQEAKERLDSYLDDNPGDQDALQLRLRLKRLLDLVGS